MERNALWSYYPGLRCSLMKTSDFDTISEEENNILADCNSVAFWYYSLPSVAVSTALTSRALTTGLLASSSFTRRFPRLPKLTLAASLGYVAGQVAVACINIIGC